MEHPCPLTPGEFLEASRAMGSGLIPSIDIPKSHQTQGDSSAAPSITSLHHVRAKASGNGQILTLRAGLALATGTPGSPDGSSLGTRAAGLDPSFPSTQPPKPPRQE